MESRRNEDLEDIVKAAEKDFPCDPALQQIHIARSIISMEAEKAGLSFCEYISSEADKIRKYSKSA
ncbi:MAG: hypothetical protein RDV48_20030 [Candidatus Eremiobacteraeota bacterium]|nr:hypothetical protein [Candidatus Eremiobacteraeota bacterium]